MGYISSNLKAIMATVFVVTIVCPCFLKAEPSSISIGPKHMGTIGLELTLLKGTRPGFLPVDNNFKQWGLMYKNRGGVVLGETELGTQVGVEYEVKLGYTSNETDSLSDRRQIGFLFRLGMPLRFLTFNMPFAGMLVLHIDSEFSVGYARWWSDTPRLSLMGGGRLATKLHRKLRVEVDYTIVPFVITRSPRHMDVNRLEQRLLVTVGMSDLGVGVQFLFSRDRTVLSKSDLTIFTKDKAISFVLEYRGLDF